MTGPVILITRPRSKPGKAEGFAAWCEEFAPLVEESEPRCLAFNIYESADHSSSVIIQVHPDADSLAYHFKLGRPDAASMVSHANLFADKVRESLDYVDLAGLELYGPPSPALTEWANRDTASQRVALHPVHRAGFTRLRA